MTDNLRPSKPTLAEPVVTYMIDIKESTALEAVFDLLFEKLTQGGEVTDE